MSIVRPGWVGPGLSVPPSAVAGALEPSGIIDVANSRGGGSIPADPWSAFAAIRSDLRSVPGKRLRLLQGLWAPSRNRLLVNVARAVVEAHGAVIQSADAGNGFDRARQPIYVPEFFDATAGSADYAATFFVGHTFATAARGTTSLTGLPAGKAGMYREGDRLLIGGQETMHNSYPFAYRFWELGEVGTGGASGTTIPLRGPTRYEYRSDWHDHLHSNTSATTGKARALNLDRIAGDDGGEFKWPELLHFLGGDYRKYSGASGAALYACAYRTIWEAIKTNCYWVAACSYVTELLDSVVPSVELDKLCYSVKIRGTRVLGEEVNGIDGGVTQGVGIENLSIEDSDLAGNFEIAPRKAHVARTVIRGRAGQAHLAKLYAGGVFHQDGMIFDQATFDPANGSLSKVVDNAYLGSLTVGSVTGTSIKVAMGSPDSWSSIPGLAEGSLIVRRDGALYGLVTTITDDGAGNWVIAHTGPAPTAGEVWCWLPCERIHLRDCIYGGAARDLWPVSDPGYGRTWHPNSDELLIEPRMMPLTAGFRYWWGACEPDEVVVDVIRAYTGGSSGPQLVYATSDAATYEHAIAVCSLATVGQRRITKAWDSGALSGDALTKANVKWGRQHRLYVMDGSGNPLAGTAAQMPLASLQVSYKPLAV